MADGPIEMGQLYNYYLLKFQPSWGWLGMGSMGGIGECWYARYVTVGDDGLMVRNGR